MKTESTLLLQTLNVQAKNGIFNYLFEMEITILKTKILK